MLLDVSSSACLESKAPRMPPFSLQVLACVVFYSELHSNCSADALGLTVMQCDTRPSDTWC